jgi:hypothetical protein
MSNISVSGRGWTSVEIVAEGVKNTQLNALLRDQANGLANGTSTEVLISKESFAAGFYTINVTVSNFLGGSASQRLSIEKAAIQIPEISVVEEHYDVSPRDYYYIKATSFSGCSLKDVVLYKWAQTSGPADIVFTSSTANPTLALSPFALLPGSRYEFELQAGYEGKQSRTYIVVINSAVDEISANAGSSKTVSTTSDIIIVPAIIDDSYPSPLDLSLFECDWSCYSNGEECVIPLSLDHSSSCESLDITGSLGGGEYVIGISVLNTLTGSRADGGFAYISVANEVIPIVQIDATSLNPGRNSPSFVINTKVDTATVSDVENVIYTWTSKSSCNGIEYSTIELIQGETTETDPNRDSSLSFKKNRLVPKVCDPFLISKGFLLL